MNTVQAELARSKDSREKVEQSRGAVRLPQNEKTDLLMAYFDIVLEHHHAICLLTEHNLYGSASALLRSPVEALFRALWANACATPAQMIQILRDDEFSFPRDMMASID